MCKKYHFPIKNYLLTEIKKIEANSLYWDAFCKESKHLTRCNYTPIFKGLISDTNELRQVIVHFHVVTDAHDQMVLAFEVFKNTCHLYGHHQPNYVLTDNPHVDQEFF